MKLFYVVSALAILAVLGIGAVLFYARPAESVSCTSLPMKPNVIAYGDSLVAGYGAPAGQDFVSVLSAASGIPIRNLGRNGETTTGGLARVTDAIDEKPDIVILLLGGNDALQRMSTETTERNLSELIRTFTTEGSEVILVGVMGGFPSDPYATMFKRLADSEDVVLVPNILSGLIGNEALMSDAIHPNADGYAKIASRIQPMLEKACAAYAAKK